MEKISRYMWISNFIKDETELIKNAAINLKDNSRNFMALKGLNAMSIFQYEGLLFFYVESISLKPKPEEIFSSLTPYLSDNIVLGKIQKFLPMYDIFHNNEPSSLTQWKRQTVNYNPICYLARLKPEQIADYIFYHQQLQEERFGSGHKYGIIYLHDNLLAFYKEFPLIPDKPSRKGKLETNNTPADWSDLMYPHFILWEKAQKDNQVWMSTELILQIINE